MSFKCGIIGLPNVGKSTLFNALTQTAKAEASNYPFCTIDPNVGIVDVPDDRLYEIAKIAQSQRIIPTQIEFVDIAGLVRGASKGQGLGNQFLSHIREVDALVHVVRCFKDSDITHVEGDVDPIRDMEIIEMELMFADIDSLERRIPNLQKKAKQDKNLQAEVALMEKVYQHLLQGKPARTYEDKAVHKLQLITTKPILYVLNVAEGDLITGNEYTKKVQEVISQTSIIVSAQIESEIANLKEEEEKKEFLKEIGLTETGLSKLIRAGYELLNLITYFTAGPLEARAWTILKGKTAPQAAGVIHTDFEKGFIRAETISYQDYIKYNGEKAKEVGRLRLEGKDYIVQDGDVLHFRFN